MIKIITDTASDITMKQAKEMDVTLLALPVNFGETQYDQLSDEDFTKFYEMLENSKELPVTSLLSPEKYLKVFEAAKKNRDSVIVIPLSSKLSGTYQSALLAKEMVEYEDIHIIDTNQALIGQRMLVEYAVSLRDSGKNTKEIVANVSDASGRIRLYAVVDTLKYLIKGGRLSKGVGIVGSALHIKPIVALKDGAVSTVDKVRGQDGAMKKLIQIISEDMDFDPDFPFCFGYTKSKGQLDELSKLAKERFNLSNTMTYPIGGVIGTHAGPNVMAAVWMVKK